MAVSIVVCSYCRSLRSLYGNKLNGTIPAELGKLTQLSTLYAQNLIIIIF